VPITPYQIVLDTQQRLTLETLSHKASAPYRAVLRARIVLAADGGMANIAIADELGVHVDTVRKWRRRFCQHGVKGLTDRPRPGRPRQYDAATVAEVKALACELPAATGTALARWSCPELSRKATECGISPAPSASTVRRWLADDAIKPWQHRSWIFPRDPYFAFKAARVLDLYARIWEGKPLGNNDFVLSADEKPGVQARSRIHPITPAGPGQPMRVEHEYERHGTLAYLAAYDVHRARVIGRCEHTTGIKPFTALVDEVMTQQPYASAHRVFWIVDNGSSHRNWAAADRLAKAHPNAIMVHLPVHASWLNQVEIFFSIVQRKVLTPDNFPSLGVLASRLYDFEDHYNEHAQPFDWKFAKADLYRLLKRLGSPPTN
jgi:transposase